MVYDLGIDVGTSYTAAAIRRIDGTVEVVGLGPIADNIPSVVYLNEDGSLIVGDAAARRAAIDPAGAAREFKRRLGDPTPLILRTSPFSAEALIAKMIDHVVARVTDRERDRPRHTVVTHPANWGPYKLELFDQAFRIANVEDHSRLPEPQAAAMAYAAEARVPNGSVVAVYDLGGGTFDAAVLRKTATGFEPLGESVGIEHLGGVDFDEAVMHHVRSQVGDRWPTDPDDPSLPAPMLHLRRACMEAKELLSSEGDVQIPVLLPGIDTSVSLDRAQFEAMITPRLEDSMSALDAAIASAGVQRSELSAVLLVGGSSRIPLVGAMLRERFGGLVAGDIDPLYAVARGAAHCAGVAAGDSAGPSTTRSSTNGGPRGASPAVGVPQLAAAAAPPTVFAPVSPPPPAAPQPGPPGAPAAPQHAARAAGPPPIVAPPPRTGSAAEPGRYAPPSTVMGPPAARRGGDNGAPPPGSHRPMAPQPLYEPEPKRGGRVKVLVPLVAVALLAAAGGAYALTRGGEDDPGTASPTSEIGTGAVEANGNGERLSAAPAADMVQIPAGTYTLGSDKPEPNQAETLTATKDIAAFYIDKYEVSNADYAAFVNQKQAAPPLSWPGGRFPENEPNRPVQGVSYDWANAYCTALGKRLPTEAEWEATARGTDARLFPWGNDAAAGGLPDNGTYDRGTVPTNVSPAGVFDLTGNAWEWVADSYDTKVDPTMPILRGGQNGYLRRSSVRLPVGEQSSGLALAGFRCAADTVDPALPALQFGGFDVPEEGNVMTPSTLPPNVLYEDQFNDATSGWIEKATERNRFGYHPNGFFHLETKTANVDVEVQSPYSVPVDEPVSVAAAAFVDPNNTTNDAGTFSYGLLFRDSISSDGNALIFIVDPRSKKWLICNRDPNSLPDASKWLLIDAKSRQIPDTVSLEVRMLAGDRYEFLIDGASVATHTLPGYKGTSAGMVLISYAGSEKAHIHFDEFQVKKLS